MTHLTKISVVTAHFGAFDWMPRLIRNLRKYTEASAIEEILVINQDRTEASRKWLEELDPQIRVLEYPRSERHFRVQGHDHAAVLNQAVKEARGNWIAIFDSDCLPMSDDWLARCTKVLQSYDALLAQEPHRNGKSHPCFMIIPSRLAPSLAFDEGLFERKTDTGRMVAQQLIRQSIRPRLLPAKLAQGGWWGHMYLGCLYHHGHGSFVCGEERLARQCDWFHTYFLRRITTADLPRMGTIEWLNLFRRQLQVSPRPTVRMSIRWLLQLVGLNPYLF